MDSRNNGLARRLGQRIARLRETRRPAVSKQDLATRIGTNRDYVARIELGDVDLPLSLAVRIAKVLGISLVTLLDGDARGSEKWGELALQASRVFADPEGKPEEASPAIRNLAELIGCYLRGVRDARARVGSHRPRRETPGIGIRRESSEPRRDGPAIPSRISAR
ncbi:MAG: helix-turn-helix transcriptional regulator [Planctomycetota bacterium]|mgnify:CR=1 FL=1